MSERKRPGLSVVNGGKGLGDEWSDNAPIPDADNIMDTQQPATNLTEPIYNPAPSLFSVPKTSSAPAAASAFDLSVLLKPPTVFYVLAGLAIVMYFVTKKK